MNKFYYLGSCSTCARIIKELGISPGKCSMQDIKAEPIKPAQLEEMQKLSGSYEALFSRVALKYRAMGLDKQNLSEAHYKKLILTEYTFLKRPVLIIGKQIFIGNSKSTLAAAKAAL
ncbi:MAG TPA: ArsC/Spx/MgsR family protein [Bacteroidia bacterium]|jgi:arsenate reductase|nr:ArsC/Spx/MgsR family protein [Bacteroidia bacterium]